MLGIFLLLWRVWQVGAGARLAPPDTLPHALRPVVAPTDTLVRIVPCPGVRRAAVGTILFAGNAVTKERILRAELDFREGDSITLADLPVRLEANRRRLFNLQLFHAVVAQASCAGTRLVIVFGVQERWYTFPVPILSLADRNLRSWLDRPDRWRRVDYGVHIVRNNFRGRNEQISGNLQLGFNRKYELFYEAPGLGRRRLGFGVGASLAQSRTVDYATLADRLVPLRTDADGDLPIQRFYLTAGLRLRHTVQFLTAFDVAYHREQISDSVKYYNPNYYLGRTQREYFDFTLTSTRNQRNTFAYPLTGQYAQASLSHRVFLRSQAPSLTTLHLTYARYLSLGHKFYYSIGLSGQTRLTRRLAYADSRALGYGDLVRGYDQYVIDGRHYGLVQQGVSYRFLQKAIQLPSLGNPKISTIPLALYLNTFADAGYVVAPHAPSFNRLPNHFLRAIGAGLHLVTYYDRVFTVEYTLNGLGQTGYFFRAEFPI